MKIEHIKLVSKTSLGHGDLIGEVSADDLLDQSLTNEEVGIMLRNLLMGLDVQINLVQAPAAHSPQSPLPHQ